jgi:predicted nucleic acid-binding protein
LKVFLDANVLFSASAAGSNISRFLGALQAQGHMLVTSQYAYDEAERNIRAKRPQWATGFRELAISVAQAGGHKLDAAISLAEKDRPILASAISEKCDYLLTGDKRDFGHLYNETVSGVTVIDYTTLAASLLK